MAATVAASEQRIEIVGDRRRAHDAAFRAQVVEASLLPGSCVRELARRHGICVSLIYRWRRMAPHDEARVASVPSSTSERAHPAGATDPIMTFVPLGTVGRAGNESRTASERLVPPIPPPPQTQAAQPRPAMDERPGMIEIALPSGTCVRVDAFVNERALRRVLAVLKAAS
jgi:transposase